MSQDDGIDYDLDALVNLNGQSFEENGYVVEFSAKYVEKTPGQPDGIDYALVFRPLGGDPIIKFDNAHPVKRQSGSFVKRSPDNYHWHRGENDPGRPYEFVSCEKLLNDFEKEIAREKKEDRKSVV